MPIPVLSRQADQEDGQGSHHSQRGQQFGAQVLVEDQDDDGQGQSDSTQDNQVDLSLEPPGHISWVVYGWASLKLRSKGSASVVVPEVVSVKPISVTGVILRATAGTESLKERSVRLP
jgi:hypothetical protein